MGGHTNIFGLDEAAEKLRVVDPMYAKQKSSMTVFLREALGPMLDWAVRSSSETIMMSFWEGSNTLFGREAYVGWAAYYNPHKKDWCDIVPGTGPLGNTGYNNPEQAGPAINGLSRLIVPERHSMKRVSTASS